MKSSDQKALEEKYTLTYENLKAVTSYKCLNCSRYYLEQEYARRCCDNMSIRINRIDLRGEYGRTTEPMLGERVFAKVHFKKQYQTHRYMTRYEEKEPFSGICVGSRVMALKDQQHGRFNEKVFMIAVSMRTIRYVLLSDMLNTE